MRSAPPDAAMLREIVLSTLRNLTLLDHWIDAFTGERHLDHRTRWALRIGSYIVVIITLAIMLHIFIKGAPVAFQSKWPFVNTKFLTELPATLHVIEDQQGNHVETDVNGADAIKKKLGDN